MELSELLLMVIEPSRMQRNIIVGHLRKMGIVAIEEFTEAAPALERMQGITPDIVISAMHLPDMTGSELVGQMRTKPELCDVTFFLISSETLYRYLEPIRQAGATVILPKPYDPERLNEALSSAVNYVAARQNDFEGTNEEFDDLWIMVVDDSSTSRKYMQRVLTSLGIHNIREAKDGAEALQILRGQRFDLIITDYNMPNIDGLELVEHIRHYSDQPSIPIVVVTSEQNDEPLHALKTAGVSAICEKPLSYVALRKLIRHLINDID